MDRQVLTTRDGTGLDAEWLDHAGAECLVMVWSDRDRRDAVLQARSDVSW